MPRRQKALHEGYCSPRAFIADHRQTEVAGSGGLCPFVFHTGLPDSHRCTSPHRTSRSILDCDSHLHPSYFPTFIFDPLRWVTPPPVLSLPQCEEAAGPRPLGGMKVSPSAVLVLGDQGMYLDGLAASKALEMNIKGLITTDSASDDLLHSPFLGHDFSPREDEQDEGLGVG